MLVKRTERSTNDSSTFILYSLALLYLILFSTETSVHDEILKLVAIQSAVGHAAVFLRPVLETCLPCFQLTDIVNVAPGPLSGKWAYKCLLFVFSLLCVHIAPNTWIENNFPALYSYAQCVKFGTKLAFKGNQSMIRQSSFSASNIHGVVSHGQD